MKSVSPIVIALALAGCGDGDPTGTSAPVAATPTPGSSPAGQAGAVYVGANHGVGGSGADAPGNYVVAFGRDAAGVLTLIGRYATGGKGSADVPVAGAPPRLDPLIAEDSLLAVENRFLLAVNAGSNSVTSFRINADFSLSRVDEEGSGGTAPISLAYRNGLVYVANADEDGVFTAPPDQSGNVAVMRLDPATGDLTRVAGAAVSLRGRPSDLEVSPDGSYLLVSSLNASSPRLPQPTAAEVSAFRLQGDGTPAATPAGTGLSTAIGNAAGRNLPNAIGIETYAARGRQFVIAAEARTVSSAGVPASSFATLQTGSVSSWEIGADGALLPRSQDVLLGPSAGSGPMQAGFLAYSPLYSTVWIGATAGATISGYGLAADGTIGRGEIVARGAAIDPGAAEPLAGADGPVDLAISPDGRWLYQLLGLKGRIDVYEIDTLVAINIARRQQVTAGLLVGDDLQGLVAVGPRTS